MDDFDEDRLPDDQPLIITSNVSNLMAFTTLIRDPARRHHTIGLVTGGPGTGKTIAADHCARQSVINSSNWIPTVAKLKVKSRATPKSLGMDLMIALHEVPKGQNVYQVADEATASIVRNRVDLVIFDEADSLNPDTFDFSRHIVDKTGCRLVLVGLPKLLSVIDSQEKFASRVALRMKFEPLSIAEIHQVVLPQMVFRFWKYSPDSAADRVLGEYIWAIVRPSLRKLRNLLQTADQIADFEGSGIITKETINKALGYTLSESDQAKAAEWDMRTDTDSYEAQSERKQRAKEKGR